MRKILLFVTRPGACIAIIGALVLLGGAVLWRGMVVPLAAPAHTPAPYAAMTDGAREAATSALRGMVGLAYEEPLGPLPEDANTQVEAVLAQALLHGKTVGGTARLAIVIDDIGENLTAARELAHLPYLVTLSVWPRSAHARKAAELGHAAGREILIHQPAEPMKYPELNPGPGALFTALPDQEIETRVRDSLARVPHAVGMNNHMGSRFTRDKRAAAAMVRSVKPHGLFVLDSLTHPGSVLYAEASRLGVPALKRDVFLDPVPGKNRVLRQLREAEHIALVTGRAVAIGHPFPYTIAALKEWESQRNTRVELVRLSALLAH